MDEAELREFMEAEGYERDPLRRGWTMRGRVRDGKGNVIPGRKPPMVRPFFISDRRVYITNIDGLEALARGEEPKGTRVVP